MEKKVALILMLLLKCPLFITSAVISPSNSPKLVKFPTWPLQDTLKKRCASFLIARYGCDQVMNQLFKCPRDLIAFTQTFRDSIRMYLLAEIGSCVEEVQLNKLNDIIQRASQEKRKDILQAIIRYVYDDHPALCLLAAKGESKSCQLLLDNGENVNRTNILGKTALMAAAQNGHRVVVNILLQRNANPHLRTVCYKNAMELAFENGYPDIASYITHVQLKDAITQLNSVTTD